MKLCLFNAEHRVVLGLSFDLPITKEAALEVASLEIGGVSVFLGDSEN